MNHLILKDGEKTTLIFVLEPGNIWKLKDGAPVVKRIEDFFPDGIPQKLELVIHYSETPISDAKTFAKMAAMTFDERAQVQKKLRPHCAECKSTIEQMGVFRNESPMAIVFCSVCGSVFGMVPQEVVKMLPPVGQKSYPGEGEYK